MRSGIFQGLLGAVALLALCVPVRTVEAAVTIERTEYKGWKEAYRLTNGTVEIVVVPSVGGRIMRYGYVGGPNVLWENPTVSGKPVPVGEWPNTGGDKVWPWDQDDWAKLTGKGWPPPPAADQLPQKAEVVKGTTLRLISEPVAPWGARIVRDIRLAPTGTAVYLTSRFRRDADGPGHPLGAWTITQVPATPWVMARLTPSAGALPTGYQLMGDKPFKSVSRTAQGMLLVERDGANSTKLGTDADLLATVQDDTLFTVRLAKRQPADNKGGTLKPARRSQFYSQPDDAEALKRGITPYIEMEMISPQKTLTKKGETVSLEQVWSLRRLPENGRTPDAVAAILRAL